MRKLVLTLSALALSAPAWAADSDSHTVTVDVQAINEVEVVGGNVSLTISSGTASGPSAASDATTADLAWSTNESDKKITVATDLADPLYELGVEAQNVSGGASAGRVVLSTVATDLVTDISLTNGTADLAYDAIAEASDGVGTDIHTVTYTITAGGI